MSETTMEAQSQARAFWPTDYARFARVVRDVRSREGDFAADALAAVISGVLAGDSPEFDPAKFEAGTHVTPPHYGELARVLKRARHVRCEPWTPKPAEQQDRVEAMVAALGGLFSASDPRFDLAKFAQSAKGPQVESADSDGDEIGDD